MAKSKPNTDKEESKTPASKKSKSDYIAASHEHNSETTGNGRSKTLVLSIALSSLIAGIIVYYTVKNTESKQINELNAAIADLKTQLDAFEIPEPQAVQPPPNNYVSSDSRIESADSAYYQTLLKLQFEFRENEEYIKNQASKYARAFAYDNEETNSIIKKWVAPKARDDFRKWLVFAIKRGIDKSNESTLRRIEYRRKAKSFEMTNE